MGPLRYIFDEKLLTFDVKATFKQATLDIGICIVHYFNKVLAEITKHAFPAYAFCKQKRYMFRHLVKHRSMKLHNLVSRLQEMNAYFAKFPSDTEGQESANVPAEGIMGITYHSMPTTWKNKMIEQGSNYADYTITKKTHFFGATVEN